MIGEEKRCLVCETLVSTCQVVINGERIKCALEQVRTKNEK